MNTLSHAAKKRIHRAISEPYEGVNYEGTFKPRHGKYVTLRSEDLRVIMSKANLDHVVLGYDKDYLLGRIIKL